MHNLHKLFRNSDDQDCLLKNLDVNGSDRAELSKARTEIRRHLRQGIKLLTSKNLGSNYEVTPKFYTQGSWAYKTLNNPAIFPPQEIDLDDGVYLPMSLINGTSPTVACNEFFNIVDKLLGVLVKQNKCWSLVDNKKTCCRIRINSKSHIDLPLYAIPDEEFVNLTEASRKHGYDSITDAALHQDTYSWLRLPSDKVWLATRDGEWEQSDPRKVNDWVKHQVDMYGEQYIYVCRYLKAWRDHQWKSGGPSSILLMVCASKDFKKYRGRDDLAFLDVAEKLITQLNSDVYSPFTETQKSLNILDSAERKKASQAAQFLYMSISSAIKAASDKQSSINFVIKEFGTRIPNNIALVDSYSHADVVRSYPKEIVPAPAIKKVKAG